MRVPPTGWDSHDLRSACEWRQVPEFSRDEPDAWLSTRSGAFAVFFPEDAHMTMISPGRTHKVVAKTRSIPGERHGPRLGAFVPGQYILQGSCCRKGGIA